jgi:F420-non-reducing hydrogenase iron-sulfur subunit
MPSREAVTEKSGHENSSWEPKMVAFVCKWCSYVGADLAGTSRTKYPENARIIRLPCTGRIDPLFIVKSFQRGADGVLVSGCHPGDCHYNKGNYYARRRMLMLRALLEFSGVDPRRVQMSWVSASEGFKWAQVMTEMTETIRQLGPAQHSAASYTRERLREEAASTGGNGQDGESWEAMTSLPHVPFDIDGEHSQPRARERPPVGYEHGN